MKVMLSAEAMQPPLSGIGYYTLHLLQSLSELPGVDVSYPFDMILKTATGQIAEPTGRRKWPASWVPRSWHRAAESVIASIFGEDIVHGTNYRYLAGGRRCLVTVHDLVRLRFPELTPPHGRHRRERELLAALERANMILTPSEAIRSELISLGLRGPDDVISTPLGVTSDFRPLSEDETMPVLQSKNLGYKKFALAVGTVEPRKNLLRLIEAYGALPDSLRRSIPLVVCGKPGWLSDGVFAAMNAAVADGWLCYIGYVTRSELVALTAAARLAVQASVYEGFCLPILEAAACGTKVLASNGAALLELAGPEWAVLPPHDTAGMTRIIEDALELWTVDPVEIERAQSMTWARCAQRTLQAYHKALNG